VKIVLSPHNDDSELFASFTCIRENPLVVVVLRSFVQESRGTGITWQQRETETEAALAELGVSDWEQWEFRDDQPDWAAIRDWLADRFPDPEQVYAPAFDLEGHPHHNAVAEIAGALWPGRVTFYSTYRNGRGRVPTGHPVRVEDGAWILRKLRALACYESQILEPSTGHHFTAALDEWYQ